MKKARAVASYRIMFNGHRPIGARAQRLPVAMPSQHIERKFARDTQRARLDWLKARIFATSSGGVTERKNAVDASEDLARKGQELREMTRDLDLLRADVAVIAMMLRLRGAVVPADVRTEEASDGESPQESV